MEKTIVIVVISCPHNSRAAQSVHAFKDTPEEILWILLEQQPDICIRIEPTQGTLIEYTEKVQQREASARPPASP